MSGPMSAPKLLLLPRAPSPEMIAAGARLLGGSREMAEIIWLGMAHAYETQGSACLNNPTRSARDRAFEIARQALCTIARYGICQPERNIVDKALADINTLLGDAK